MKTKPTAVPTNPTEQPSLSTPYFEDYRELQGVTNLIPDCIEPYLTKEQLPNLPDGFKLYKIPSTDPLANSAKAFEATIKQAKWGEDRTTAAEEAKPIEDNSFFFVLLDENADEPAIACTLRIADVTDGRPSETRSFFARSFPDAELPEGLDVTPGEKTWDVVLVAAAKEYNDGKFTPWVYHALYRASLKEGVTRWIANINDREHGNLDALRIPFELVSDDVVTVTNKNGNPIPFRFYDINVKDIRDSMSERIVDLTRRLREFGAMSEGQISGLDELEQIEAIASPLWLQAAQIALRGGGVFFDEEGMLVAEPLSEISEEDTAKSNTVAA
jgi:hypothetical protein